MIRGLLLVYPITVEIHETGAPLAERDKLSTFQRLEREAPVGELSQQQFFGTIQLNAICPVRSFSDVPKASSSSMK